MEPDVNEAEIHHSRSQLDVYEDISNLRASDLKLRIEEMLRIKVFFLAFFICSRMFCCPMFCLLAESFIFLNSKISS